MTNSDQLIDQIVANVLDQLGRTDPPCPKSQGAAIEIHDDVITAALLEERATAAGPILIGAKSVLTPSARDFLAKRSDRWSRSNGKHGGPIQKAKWLCIVAHSTPAVAAALSMIDKEPIATWKHELAGCHREAASRAIDAICRGECEGVLVLTSKPEAVACRANRNEKVRAAGIATVARIRAIRNDLQANVYAIDPSNVSAFELKKLMQEIASSATSVSTQAS